MSTEFQPARNASPLDLTADHSRRILERAESIFQRTLVAWAGDVLELRRRGELAPSWAGGLHLPSQAEAPIVPMKKAA
ncbi:MAG: hypothetical protein RI967_786 [Planctomycetota bacterium]|jgi:hypothetical protein